MTRSLARILRQKKPHLARQTRFFFLACEQDPFVKSGSYFSRVTKEEKKSWWDRLDKRVKIIGSIVTILATLTGIWFAYTKDQREERKEERQEQQDTTSSETSG